MKQVKIFINNIPKNTKIISLIFLFILILFVFAFMPTLSRYKNRNITTLEVWDGSVATSYKNGNGTKQDPYIISNGKELAYLQSELDTLDYDGVYFELNNDIILNSGLFLYEDNLIKYIIDENTYYIDEYSNKYYTNSSFTEEVGTLNIFNSLNGFKGNFNGNSYRIYGLYMTSEMSNELALFTGLEGNIDSLYVENTLIYGGNISSGVVASSNSSNISNVLFSGFVIGNQVNYESNLLTLDNTEFYNEAVIDSYVLTNGVPKYSSIQSTRLTGNYVVEALSEEDTRDLSGALITINGIGYSNGSFDINLGANLIESIDLNITSSLDNVRVIFSNVSYNVNYNYSISSGIVGIANNSNIKNVVNKGDIYGFISSGIIGIASNNVEIRSSYTKGNVDGTNISSGILSIGDELSNIGIHSSYSVSNLTGLNKGNIIGLIENSTRADIFNVFSVSNEHSIGIINSTDVYVVGSYYAGSISPVGVGSTIGNFVSTPESNLKSETFLTNNLNLSKYVNFEDLNVNNSNIWVFENNDFPIIYIDDSNSSLVTIHANIYSWGNYSDSLSRIRINSSLVFSLKENEVFNTVKEMYYYISNKELSYEELENVSFVLYEDLVTIDSEDNYIIYAKIVDITDNIIYLNSDILEVDLPGVDVEVALDTKTWNRYISDIGTIYLDTIKTVVLNVFDDISNIKTMEYYVSDSLLTKQQLNNINEWITYQNEISIDSFGIKIFYFKIVDSFDYVTYINTDKLIYKGYDSTLYVGRNELSYNDIFDINSKSLITLKFNFEDTIDYGINKHNLITNKLLPKDTNIILIDKTKNKIYKYNIDTSNDIYGYNTSCNTYQCEKFATYSFELFKDIKTNENFVESSYYKDSVTFENFELIIDFKNTNMSSNNLNFKCYLTLKDYNNKIIISTLKNKIKPINIYVNKDATLDISTSYTGSTINFNSNSTTNIDIISKLNYSMLDDKKIIDTRYENQKMGLAITVEKQDGTKLNKEQLRSIIFKIDGINYHFESDNVIRVNLNNSINDTNKILNIITHENKSIIETGTYYIRIKNFVSNDGIYYDNLNNNGISIPLYINGYEPLVYGFNIMWVNETPIINKSLVTNKFNFNIINESDFVNPSVRVSLFKKSELTAFNQTYNRVDLKEYVTNNLNEISNQVYDIGINVGTFELDSINQKFENTGYKLVFELYDGEKYIDMIQKYFIVK